MTRATIPIVLTSTVCGALGCAEATPFEVLVENRADVTLYSGTRPEKYVDRGGEWEPPSLSDDGCYRECGQPSAVCFASGGLPAVLAILPGDTVKLEKSGEARQGRTDAFGACSRVAPLVGPVLVELCIGDEAWEIGAHDSFPPTASGELQQVKFAEIACASAVIELPDETEVVLSLDLP